MKHSLKITFIIILMFIIANAIGLFVINAYKPEIKTEIVNGTSVNITEYRIPYGLEPPKEIKPEFSLFSIFISLAIAILLMLALMKIKAEFFLKLWFFAVVFISLAIAINSFLINLQDSALISLAVSLPLAFLKIYKRNIIIHNFTELLIYPGIAAIFVPMLSITSAVALLIVISAYDMYAVWHSGFMQKMVKYQIKTLRIFSGFFIPYLPSKTAFIENMNNSKNSKKKAEVKISVAILGGGDVALPLILSGVVLWALGPLSAVIVSLCSAIALSMLLYFSEKGKFYPAMPFITAGSLIGLALAYLV